jgi:hypothetical protein
MFTRAVVVFAKVPGRILAYPVVVLLALAVASADQLGAVGPSFSVDLSHFAAFGGWNTLWSVVNTSPGPNQCTLTIVGPDGKPLSLTTTAGTGSSINIGVALGGSAVIQAGGPTGSVVTGASNVTCTATFIASLRYQWMPAGVVETQVSVGPTNPFINHVFAANAYTAISMYDPDTTAAAATITACDLNGNTVGSATATVPALGKTIGNLNVLIPTLPSSFEGKVAITANDGIEVVALDVTPGAAGSFVLGNVPVVHYNPQSSSYSGTYNFISGPQSGQTGTFTITNISPVGDLFGEATYLGTASNTTISGPVNVVEYNNGQVFLRFMAAFTPLAHAGGALTQESDGSFSGALYMEGTTGSSIASVTIH